MQKFINRLHNPDLAALFVRLALGIVFINAGWFKVNNIDGVVGFFGSLGIPAVLAYYVAYIEFLGGIALILGIFVRPIGILFAINMLVAIAKVHYPKGFSLKEGGYEYVLVLMLGSLALATLGAGKYAIGRLFRKQ
jgi:putative oxidoreductase